MKKLISILICLAMVLGMFSVSADVLSPDEVKFMQANGYLKGRGNGLELESLVTRAEALTLLLRTCDEEDDALNNGADISEVDYETVSGSFVRTEENGIVIKDGEQELLITTENAVFRGEDISELKEGSIVSAVVSKIRTRSIPAMTNAYLVVASDTVFVNCIEVEKVEMEDGVINIYSKDGEFIVVADEKTPVSPFATRNIMSILDVSENDKLFVLSEVMTMSLPARINPVEVIVYQNEFTVDVEDNEEIEEVTEDMFDAESIVGEFVSVEEDGIVIRTENGLVKIDTADAILEGTSVDEAKEGNLVSAVVSKKQTRSIPAIAKGYAVIISEITSVKYIEVSKVEVEDGVYKIFSNDGEFIAVADENTVISPYKTKNIIAVSDISEGDKVFVLSDVSTMSIPAQLMANKIIVFEDEAETETSEAVARAIDVKPFAREDKNFKDAEGHWAEKIIKYSYKKGYVDGESEDTFNPEGKVKGRELVKMMLSKVGKEDITIENAFEIAKEFGLIADDVLENVVEKNAELKRDEVAKLCYNLIKIINPEKIAD